MEAIYVGIDLGTTNTLACFFKNGKMKLAKFSGSGKLLPSILFVDASGKIYVGSKAKVRMSLEPQNGIRSAKTEMGNAQKTWTCHGQTFTPTQVAAEILKAVRQAVLKSMKAEDSTPIRAVITVPAYFNANQRDETKKAAQAAGLEVLQIITEPMAAAIAAGKELDLNKKIFVADLGGGTFDVSVLEADTRHHAYKALDIDGDHHLGGDDFDQILLQHLFQLVQADCGVDLTSPDASGLELMDYYSVVGSLRETAEEAKKELSGAEETEIEIPALFSLGSTTYNFSHTLTRDEFNQLCQPLYDKVFQRVQRFLSQSSRFQKKDIGAVILAGGSCYIPYIQEQMQQIFQQPVDTSMDLTTLVVNGACLVAESLRSGLGTDLGADASGEQAEPIVIQDIIAHSLGVQVVDDQDQLVLNKVLVKGEAYPCERTQYYTTDRDFQTDIPVDIYEAGADAEDKAAIENHDFYGSFVLENVPPERQRKARIAVTFSYDISGCLTVTAVDEHGGQTKQLVIHKGEKPVQAKATAGPATDMVVLLDASGSMRHINRSGKRSFDEAKAAYIKLVEDMVDLQKNRVALFTYEDSPQQISSLSHDRNELVAAACHMTCDVGGTYIYPALTAAAEAFPEKSKDKKVILILTDDYFLDDSPEAVQLARSLQQNQVQIICVGAGNDIDEKMLEKYASPNCVYTIDSMSQLADTFQTIAERIRLKE